MAPPMGNEIAWCVFGVSAAVFLRLCTTLHPYSGEGKPPMFGDYEAQRHWMEITVQLPMNQWYRNTSDNDLNYWGLDYPPLTAYHSYVNGLLAWLINPAYVKLAASHGYESQAHKLFMRYTVLAADLLIYIPAVVIFYLTTASASSRAQCRLPLQSVITLALIYPGLILIDHGHFQYNCISLGLTVLAVTALVVQWDISGSILFVLAVNYKQMELYHAFPFFLYLLSSCIPKPGASALSGVLKLCKLAASVLATFGVLWLPFLLRADDALQVLHRLFPIARGLFEDKVANVWCALNVVYKLRAYCPTQLVRYCTLATLAALLPSSANLFLNPSARKLVPALINSALAFFLFSYQVHEKSILLVAVPVVLYLPARPLACFWFLYVSTFSLLPLCVQDRLVVAYVALTMLYVTAFAYCHQRWGETPLATTTFAGDVRRIIVDRLVAGGTLDVARTACKRLVTDAQMLKELLLYATMFASFAGSLVLTVLLLAVEPPTRYPDLFSLMIAVYSCAHFLGFFLYFNIVQFSVPEPERFDSVEHSCRGAKPRKKVKTS